MAPDPDQCSHERQLEHADGSLECLICGYETAATRDPEPVVLDANPYAGRPVPPFVEGVRLARAAIKRRGDELDAIDAARDDEQRKDPEP